jgi:hypothetical protein
MRGPAFESLLPPHYLRCRISFTPDWTLRCVSAALMMPNPRQVEATERPAAF